MRSFGNFQHQGQCGSPKSPARFFAIFFSKKSIKEKISPFPKYISMRFFDDYRNRFVYSKIIFPLSFLFSITAFSQDMKILWQSDSLLRHPESIAYDAKRNCLYVSNMDKNTPLSDLYTDPISMVSTDGKTIEVEWMKGFSSPTGLVLKNDTLYIVEKNGIAIVDVEHQKIIQRISIDSKGFLNDLTIDDKGRIFVTESEKEGKIYLIENGKSSIWFSSKQIGGFNGIFADGKYLILGVNSDHTLKKICVKSQKIKDIAYLGEGNIDGIQKTKLGKYLVSHFLGNIYEVCKKGKVNEIFNSRDQNLFVADFAYVPGLNQIFIPSLRTNHVFSLYYEK